MIIAGCLFCFWGDFQPVVHPSGMSKMPNKLEWQNDIYDWHFAHVVRSHYVRK